MLRRIVIGCALAAALLQPGIAADAAHQHGAAKGSDAAAQVELGAQAVFDARGILWAVHKVSGHIAVSRSEDRGASWSNPVLVTRTPEPTDPGGDARPKIALGPDGEIFLTWTKPLAAPYTGEIRFCRSLDGGRTFSTPVVVHRDRREITHRFDTLAVTPDGRVFVAWIDKRDLIAAGNDPKAYRGAALYFAVSNDRGASFRGDFKAADHACECCRIALLPRPDGSVTAMWRHIFPPNVRDHAIAELRADGKAGAIRRVTFDDWRIDACPHHGPAFEADTAGRLHAVWFSAAPNRRGLFQGQLGHDKVEGQRRLGASTAGHGDLATHGERVVVAWKEFTDGRSRLMASISEDGGRTWREVGLASASGPADHPRVLCSAGRFFVFWNTREKPLHVVPVP